MAKAWHALAGAALASRRSLELKPLQTLAVAARLRKVAGAALVALRLGAARNKVQKTSDKLKREEHERFVKEQATIEEHHFIRDRYCRCDCLSVVGKALLRSHFG